jgi:hypothetical protein
MTTLCRCGFDCGDFVAQHDIGNGARISCPVCEQNIDVSLGKGHGTLSVENDGRAVNSNATA